MLFGFQSFYAMTKAVCGKKIRRLMLLGGVGVGAVSLAHFTLGSLLPLTYKAILESGGSAELAGKACRLMDGWVLPLNIVIIALLYVQFVVLCYMLLSGKSGLPGG